MEGKLHTRRPRGSLNQERILDAAEQIARDGFDALTMRAVAGRLQAAPMALYRHFATKDELVEALLDRVLGRFAAATPTGDWRDDLHAFAHAHRLLLDRHPWALAPLVGHPSPGLNAVRIGEHALEIMREAGFDEEHAVATFSGLIALNYGWASFSNARLANPSYAVELRHALASLPVSEYPHTVAATDELADYASNRHYDLVLDGLLQAPRPESRLSAEPS